MEIRPNTQGASIPLTTENSYRPSKATYLYQPAEILNVRPINLEPLPRMSNSKPAQPEHKYYSGERELHQSQRQAHTESSNLYHPIYEKTPTGSDTYQGGFPYNRGSFPGLANAPQDSLEAYKSRDHSNYSKHPPTQRDYVPHERESGTNFHHFEPHENNLPYRGTGEMPPKEYYQRNPSESTLLSQRYPPPSINYSEGRKLPTGGLLGRGAALSDRDEYLDTTKHPGLNFSNLERRMDIKMEELRGEQRGRNSSPLALDKVVENCRMLSHFAFEYGNRSDKAYPYPSDDLVREMASKAQDILRVLTGLKSESIKSGNRNEQALDEDDMEYIRNKRTLLAPSRPKYRKRSKRSGQPPPGRCHSCNTTETPEWRRGPDGARTLCNACGLHFAKLTRKRALVAASSVNDTTNSDSGEKGSPRRSDGEGKLDSQSIHVIDA